MTSIYSEAVLGEENSFVDINANQCRTMPTQHYNRVIVSRVLEITNM